MRFLFLILSLFFYFAPVESKASGYTNASGYTDVQLQGDKSDHEERVIISITDRHSTAISYSNNSCSLSLRYTVLPYTNFVNSGGYFSNPEFVYETSYAVCPYLYCKTIGLKLIFPEHYFW